MSIGTDLQTELKKNRYELCIIEADDLIAAWRFKKSHSFTRSVDFSRVPEQWRYSAPPSESAALMPCHVSYSLKSGRGYSCVKPAYELGTGSCHNWEFSSREVPDLTVLNAAGFAKRNFAPYVSPILDTVTLAHVCNDLGINGRAFPKTIRGRQYIAFSGYPGIRALFPGTTYSERSRKLIQFAIGSLGIKNMAVRGSILTLFISVPLSILECFLSDHATMSAVIGTVASDLVKIGVTAIISALVGLAVGGVTTVAAAPIAAVIVIGLLSAAGLGWLDDKYRLTERLITELERLSEKIEKNVQNKMYDAQSTFYRGMTGFLRSQGYRGPF